MQKNSDPAAATEPASDPAAAGAEELKLEESLQTIGESLTNIWTDFLARLPFLAAGVAILVGTWLVGLIVRKAVRATVRHWETRASLKDLVEQVAYVTVWMVGLLVTAMVVFPGVTPVKILTVLGLGSIAIGFAFKDIIENFFAGILILWRFPFEAGDFIQCGEIHGKVEDTTIRMTRIQQTDGQLVVLPNAMLFKQPVNVLTSKPVRRTTVICGVAYDENVDECRDVIRNAVDSCPSVDKDHPVDVFAQEFAASSINFEVTWWCGSTPLEVRQSRDEVVTAIKRDLDQAGIEIPFPYRTLTFKGPLRTENRNSSESFAASEASEND